MSIKLTENPYPTMDAGFLLFMGFQQSAVGTVSGQSNLRDGTGLMIGF